jgi:hypothetical protein
MKPDVILKNLEKLFAKKKALDKQIEDAQKKLVSAVKIAAKAAPKTAGKGKSPAKKASAKKAGAAGKRGRKPKALNSLSME